MEIITKTINLIFLNSFQYLYHEDPNSRVITRIYYALILILAIIDANRHKAHSTKHARQYLAS